MNFRSLFAAARPTVAVGIAPDRVTAIAVARHGDAQVVTAHGAEPLPPGAVEPQLTAGNIADRAAVVAALRRVFERIGQRPSRVALAVPDTSAKVSLFRFEKVPARGDDLEQLIRWQLKKAAPFKVEEGQVSWSRGVALDGGGREFVVVLARRDVVREYESVCAEVGAHPGLVDLASFGVIDAALAATQPTADWLLVHVTAGYASIAILRGQDLIFYRNRAEEADGDLAGLVHQTAMYHEDRLGGAQFAKVVLVVGATPRGGTESGDSLRRGLEERLRTGVELLAADRLRFGDRVSTDRAALDLYAPLMGLLLR
ncbi:MAG: type IV pilus biogenesis protein PilM [Bacteroidales bacterium]